jgi:hypothetical protein
VCICSWPEAPSEVPALALRLCSKIALCSVQFFWVCSSVRAALWRSTYAAMAVVMQPVALSGDYRAARRMAACWWVGEGAAEAPSTFAWGQERHQPGLRPFIALTSVVTNYAALQYSRAMLIASCDPASPAHHSGHASQPLVGPPLSRREPTRRPGRGEQISATRGCRLPNRHVRRSRVWTRRHLAIIHTWGG